MKYFILFFLFLSNWCFSQFIYNNVNDLKLLNLSKKVKRYTTKEEFLKANDSTKPYYKKIQYYSFNRNGKITKKIDSSSLNGKIFEQDYMEEISYNSKGKPILKEKFYGKNKKIISFEYPKDSVVIITTKNNNNILSILKIIKKKLKEYTYENFFEDGKAYIKGTYEYDRKNRMISFKEESFNSSNESINSEIKSYYNKKCYPEIKSISSNYINEYTLNQNCDIVRKTTIVNKDSSVLMEYEYSYIYDKNGNWIERTTFLNKKKQAKAIRKILYF